MNTDTNGMTSESVFTVHPEPFPRTGVFPRDADGRRPGVEDSFGLCPICLGEPIFRNIGRDHIASCDEHKVKWRVGSNLFSAWRDETEEVWKQNAADLENFKEVKPRCLPESEAIQKARENYFCRVTTLLGFLSESKRELVLTLLCELANMKLTDTGMVSRDKSDSWF